MTIPKELDWLSSLISHDDRPTFVLHWNTVIYCNRALERLIDSGSDQTAFHSWAISQPLPTSTSPTALNDDFCDQRWSARSLEDTNGWSIVHCTWQSKEIGHNGKTARNQNYGQNFDSERLGDWFVDWFRIPLDQPHPNAWVERIRRHDFENTAIGPLRQWSPLLRSLVISLLTCPDPRVLLWGDKLLMVYNEAAIPVMGENSISALGNSIVETFGKHPHDTDMHVLRDAMKRGVSTTIENVETIGCRHGHHVEEAYFKYHILPVSDPDGFAAGMSVEFLETTSAVFEKRRVQLGNSIMKSLSHVHDVTSFWSQLVEGFETETDYIMYSLVFSVANQEGKQNSFDLQASSSQFPETALPTVAVRRPSSSDSLLYALERTVRTTEPVILRHDDGSLPSELAVSVPARGSVDTVCFLPIPPCDETQTAICLAIAFNPRKRFDHLDMAWVKYIHDLITRSFRLLNLPIQDRGVDGLESLNLSLRQELRLAALKAEKNEDTFARITKHAPFGMYMFQPILQSPAIFTNEAFAKLLGFDNEEQLRRHSETGEFWRGLVPEEDYEATKKGWEGAIASTSVSISQHRLLIPADASRPEDGPRWVESISLPELDDEGKTVAVRGWLVDISHRKTCERLLEERLQDALENKRASENFIDMVSHEIRNPLSAILQLSDQIITALSPIDSKQPPSPEDVASVVDAAQTTVLCTHHIKKIADDVLVMSKLDSNLLVMSPEKCHAPSLLDSAIKMHSAELNGAGIKASCQVDESFERLVGTSCVLFDESRALQVILNLLGNAIKFTRNSDTKHITLELSASSHIPQDAFAFAPNRPKAPSSSSDPSTPSPHASSGKEVYVQFAVTDSGRGLAEEEIQKLFQKFSQANPRTYKEYGGSGLGLFISKELCELQGGQIGVKSEGLGQGSSFMFYIKAAYLESSSMDISTRDTPTRDTPTRDTSTRDTSSPSRIENKTTTHDQTSNSTNDLHVLIVEDNKINAKVISQSLRKLGAKAHVADHGGEALSFLEASSFYSPTGTPLSVVLMDVEMPIMDGLTCTRLIRQLEGTGEVTRHVPIIAITANARNEHVNAALDAGVDQVVTKPFRISELLPQMQELVQRFAQPTD